MEVAEKKLSKEENILKPILVGDLLKYKEGKPQYQFMIPSYQRGYRWDEQQVTDLLDDLLEFINTPKSTSESYCLQPIVVKKLENGKFEVLDGQQRLTTIFILLSRLRKTNQEINLFSISYETRPDSETFLRDLDGTLNDTNPDYYYISNAYKVIDSWLISAKNDKPNITTKIFDILVESVEFIWYEIVDKTDPIDVFTRINIGKIPLTNAELVKAVFLSKNNLSLGYASEETNDKNFEKILSLKQNIIALEWDDMENTLQDDKFWGFIYPGEEEFETRIDYLLNLQAGKATAEKNKYFSFKHFYDRVKQIRNDEEELHRYAQNNTSFIEEEWNKLKLLFRILTEWYENKTYNHLTGFLINQKTSIKTLVDQFQDQNRQDFDLYLKREIRSRIGVDDISELRYHSNKAQLNSLLLFHNVYNSLKVEDNNIYFPYDKIKGKQWTLEHIFAQNSDDLKQDDYKDWLNDHLDFFENRPKDEKEVKEIISEIQALVNKDEKKIDQEEFQSCFERVKKYIQNLVQEVDKVSMQNVENETLEDQDWINEDHSIANLALLDGSVNSAIKNSLFEIKRKMILEKDKQGQFIPIETKKVFLKYHTDSPNHLSYWTYADRDAYVKNIKESLSYLN